MTIQHLYPTTRPSLDLNFARTKRLDPRVTFTRGSTATYVGSDGLIKTAANNEARFDHNPTTGESLGLLVEEARTNLRTLSANFSTGWSYNANVTVASGQTSPTGDSTASLITLNAGTFQAKLAENFFSNNNVYARSWFVKKTNQRYIWCGDQNNGNYAPNYRFDLDLGTGTVVSGGGFNSGFTITPYANGYYRISVVCISQDLFCISANNTTSVNPLSQSSAHDGTETFVIWGYQIEQASFSTSYIPTSGSTVTRSADVASMTGTNFSSWYNQAKSTLVVDMSINSLGNYSTMWAFDGHRIEGYPGVSTPYNGLIYFYNYVNEKYVGRVGDVSTAWPANVRRKCAYSWDFDTGTCSVCLEPNAVSSATGIPNTLAVGFYFYRRPANLGNSGHIARLTYYPTRLTDAQLQALTL